MKIVVLGAGYIGYEIAKQLSFEEHDVSVIDSNPDIVKQLGDKLDVKPVLGNAVDLNTLREAGISDSNILIATTSSDETNIVACQIADFVFGVETKIAKINQKSYFDHTNLFGKNKFAIEFVVSPDIEISSIIKQSISVHGALDFISCMDDQIKIIGIQCAKRSVFSNIPMKFLPNILHNIQIVILFIERNNISFIPQHNEVILEGDKVYLAVKSNETLEILTLFGIQRSESNCILLIGGGSITKEITHSIIQEDPDINIKIIENNLDIAKSLSKIPGNIEIIYGEPLNKDILDAELISKIETVIAITTDDKTNILSCLIAKALGVKRVSSMIKEIANISLFHALGINTILDPKKVVVSKILQYIRKGGSETISTLSDENIEIFVINVNNNSKAIGLLVDDINSTGKIQLSVLIRADKIFLKPKRMIINAGDKLLFAVEKNIRSKIINLFKDKPKYL